MNSPLIKNLTAAQQEELFRIARGVEFEESIPAWRLVHMGLAVLVEHDGKRYVRITAQGRVYLGEMV